jgi:hypothetical protein
MIVKQIFKIKNSSSIENETHKEEKIGQLFLEVSLDICFHNLSKYLPLKISDSNDNNNVSQSLNSLINEDAELLIATFSIFDTLYDHYSSDRKGMENKLELKKRIYFN